MLGGRPLGGKRKLYLGKLALAFENSLYVLHLGASPVTCFWMIWLLKCHVTALYSIYIYEIYVYRIHMFLYFIFK